MNAELSGLIVEAIRQVSGQQVAAVAADQKIATLGLDSVSMMELVGTLEERVNATFAEEELQSLETFGDLAKLISARKPSLSV